MEVFFFFYFFETTSNRSIKEEKHIKDLTYENLQSGWKYGEKEDIARR